VLTQQLARIHWDKSGGTHPPEFRVNEAVVALPVPALQALYQIARDFASQHPADAEDLNLWGSFCRPPDREPSHKVIKFAVLQTAKNPATPVGILAELPVQHPLARPQDIARGLASNPSTPPSRWKELAELVPRIMALRLDCTSQQLEQIIKASSQQPPDIALRTRQAVANNPNTSRRVLLQLCDEPKKEIRKAVARNPHSSVAILHRLLYDQAASVQRAALNNPSLPRATLAMWQLAHGSDIR